MAVPACPLTWAGICASWLNSDASDVCMGLSFATPENKCSLPSREAKKWREKCMDRMTSSAQSAKRTNPAVRLLRIYESPSRIPTLVTALLPGAAGCLVFAVNEATERRSPSSQIPSAPTGHLQELPSSCSTNPGAEWEPPPCVSQGNCPQTWLFFFLLSLFWEMCNEELHFLFPLQHIQICGMRFVIIKMRAECWAFSISPGVFLGTRWIAQCVSSKKMKNE